MRNAVWEGFLIGAIIGLFTLALYQDLKIKEISLKLDYLTGYMK